jgi:AraC-like DNA-binding protein
VKNSLRLQNTEGPKNTFPDLIVEKRLNIPSARRSHHTTGTRDLVIHLLSHYGPSFSGCGRLFSVCKRLDDSPSHLQHYINRRVGVKLPQYLLLMHCCAAEKFDHSQSLFIVFSIRASSWFSFVIRGSFGKIAKSHQLRQNHKKFSIKWPECVQQLELHATERRSKLLRLPPISEVMRQSGLVVTEGASDEGAPAAEAEPTDIEESNADCWGLALKCYELRTRQHKMLNIKALRPSKHYFLLDIMDFGRRF